MKVDINFSIMVTEMSFVRIFFLWSMLLSVICIDGFAQSTKQESEDQVMPRLVGRHYQRQENISGKEILVYLFSQKFKACLNFVEQNLVVV